jgi:hypothetical protein
MCCGNDDELAREQTAAARPVSRAIGGDMTVRYIGDGLEFYPGLQNADLTDEQWEALPEAVRVMLVQRKMFEVGESDSKARAKKGGIEAKEAEHGA